MKVMREVIIRPVMNGFVVQVGCQQLVFTDIDDVARSLVAYQQNPEAIEKDFTAHQVNKTYDPYVTGPQRAPALACNDAPQECATTRY